MVRCVKCRIELHEKPTAEDCPECGGNDWEIIQIVNELISIAERLRGRGKGDFIRKGRRSYDLKFGHDYHKKTGKWNWIHQEIDRRKITSDEDRYRKKIINPDTGIVIRDTNEPLRRHQGYGSAKKKPKG